MTTPVSQAATAFDLSAVRTGQPVVSGGWSRWSEELSFLLAHDLHVCGGASILPRPMGRTQLVGLAYVVRVPYSRSPGAQVVRVSCELAPSDLDTTQLVTVTLPAGATWLRAGGLDGTVEFPNPPAGRSLGEELVGWVDVSGVAAGLFTDSFAFGADGGTGKGAGIRRCYVVEVPLAALDNVSTEPVLDGASVRPGRAVVDGGVASTAGAERLFVLLDLARAGMRRHLCLAGVESADAGLGAVTPHWYRDAVGAGPIQWLHPGGGPHDVAHYLRVRDLYATAAATPYKLVVRYRTSGAAAGVVTLLAQGGALSAAHLWVGAGAVVVQALALPGTAGAWAWASVGVVLPGDGTLGLVRVTWEATTPLLGVVYLATLALIEQVP